MEPVLFNRLLGVAVGACTDDLEWTDDVSVLPLFAVSPNAVAKMDYARIMPFEPIPRVGASGVGSASLKSIDLPLETTAMEWSRGKSCMTSCGNTSGICVPAASACSARNFPGRRRLPPRSLFHLVPCCAISRVQQRVVFAQRLQFLTDFRREPLAGAAAVDEKVVQILFTPCYLFP